MKSVEPPQISRSSGQPWPLSVEAYHVLGEAGLIPKDTELLYGFVYKKVSKSPVHSSLVTRFVRLLQAALPSGWLMRSEQPITCADSEPEPDVAVIRGSEEDFWNEHPKTAELVIEICVSNSDYDRSKLRAYATAKVKEVWLVLVPERQIEVHRQPARGTYAQRRVCGPGGRLTCASFPAFSVDLKSFFSRT